MTMSRRQSFPFKRKCKRPCKCFMLQSTKNKTVLPKQEFKIVAKVGSSSFYSICHYKQMIFTVKAFIFEYSQQLSTYETFLAILTSKMIPFEISIHFITVEFIKPNQA